ncbi:MAG: hypothetical protein QXP36_01135 [Conexivisphaerales archaeon]
MEKLRGLGLVAILMLSMFLGFIPSVFADYTVPFASFPPDLPGDINNDGMVDIFDISQIAIAYASKFYTEVWNPLCDISEDGEIDIEDLCKVAIIFGKEYYTSTTPIAYSTSFEFIVPNDGDENVWYYILVRFYVPTELEGKVFNLLAGKSVDDGIRNVRVDTKLKQPSQVGGLFNIQIGQLNSGYHLLELEYLESTGGGLINFTIKTQGEYAWLDRFRIYVPNYGDSEVRYTVKTCTYFPGDTFFLGSSANQYLYVDDYIDDVYVDAGLLWEDWMWNMGEYGAIYAWGDGFLYPLGWQSGWHTIKFTYGEIWGPGLLDFQYISQTNQPAKISNPRFWARISEPSSPYPPGNIRHLKIYDVKAWAGSKWASTIGGSVRTFAFGLKILANATDTNTFYPIPQEAEVTLILDMLGYELPYLSPQDIGLHINVTYTYFDEQSFVYSFPIWFEANSIELKVATQGAMLYAPYPSIVFTTQSSTSFITPEWKTAYETLKWLTSFVLGKALGPVGIVGAAYLNWRMNEYMYRAQQQLNSTWEEPGPPTYRKYHMNPFKTTKDQLPLSQPVRSISNGYFFRIMPSASQYCGAINITLQGRLWPPFFYSGEPPPDSPNWYGEWLPIDVGISIITPVFVKG